ncbi:MAG: ABC transporter permease [Clostridiales bacterium]|jgi:peptide/nickel transport system permease protein|nr:ABC transporter permease [Clostridiales bacterium]
MTNVNPQKQMSKEAMAPEKFAGTKRLDRFMEVWRRFRRNPLAVAGLVMILLMGVLAISADWIAPGTEFDPGYDIQNLPARLVRPGDTFNTGFLDDYGNPIYESVGIFGTDHLGRDMLGRIAHGSRITLLVAFLVVTISMTLGVTLGAIAGFYGGVSDNIIMRVIDVILAMPTILLAITIAAALDPGLHTIIIAVGVGAIPGYARITRAQVLTLRDQEFVEAARSVGANDFRLIRKHILPNCMAPIIVEATMGLAGAIASAAALSFLGIGLAPPTPEWGAMLADGRRFMLAGEWHMTVFPGVAIAMIIFSLNMMGDGLRDAFDPRLRSAGFSKKRFKRQLQAIEAKKAGAKEV